MRSRFSRERTDLLVILLSLVVDDVVEAELIDTLGGGDDTEPVTELLLLQVLLGAIVGKITVSRLVHMASRADSKTHRYLR